ALAESVTAPHTRQSAARSGISSQSLRGGATLDPLICPYASLDDHLGDGEKILTSPQKGDTINTTEARQSREKGWHTMEIIINETGKREELTIIDRKTGQDMAADIIGNSGAVGDYITIEDGVYSMSAENYQWWSDCLD